MRQQTQGSLKNKPGKTKARKATGPARSKQTKSQSKVAAFSDSAQDYNQLVPRVRQLVKKHVPKGSTIAVVSKGDPDLVVFPQHSALHLPRTAQGDWAGFHPSDDNAAITHLEDARAAGAQYLLIPATCLWWLEYYGGFTKYLNRAYRQVAADPAAVLYELAGVPQSKQNTQLNQLTARVDFLLSLMTPLLEGLKSPPVPTEPASPQAEEPSVEDNQDLTDPQPVAEAIPEAPTEPIEADQNPVDEPNPLEEQVRQLQLQLNELQERFDQRVEHGENLAGQVEALTARQDQLSDQQADLAEKQIKAAIEAGQKSAENPLAEELQQIQSRLDELQVGLNERGEHADTLFVQLDALSARQDQLFDQQAEFAAAREAHDLSIARTEEQLATQQDQLSRQIQTAYEALEVRLAELEQRTEAQPGPEGTLTPLGQQSAQLPEATLSSIELRLANLESFAEAQEAINAGNQEHFAGQNQTLEDFRQHLAQQQTDLEGSLGHINSQLEANEIKHQEHAEAIENLANAVGGDDSRTPATGGLNQRFDELAARVQQRHHTPLPGRRPEQ